MRDRLRFPDRALMSEMQRCPIPGAGDCRCLRLPRALVLPPSSMYLWLSHRISRNCLTYSHARPRQQCVTCPGLSRLRFIEVSTEQVSRCMGGGRARNTTGATWRRVRPPALHPTWIRRSLSPGSTPERMKSPRSSLDHPSLDADDSGVSFMPSEFTLVEPVALPEQSSVTRLYDSTSLADAYAVRLPLGAAADPEVLWRFVMSQQPFWIGWLTNFRDAIVACFGLKTAKRLATLSGEADGDRIAFFRVYSRSETEIVLGEDDRHLDFRLSVLCSPDSSPTLGGRLTVSTVVHCHNLLGRAYIWVIAPFHRLVVKGSLRRAAQIGWPKAGAADRDDSPDL